MSPDSSDSALPDHAFSGHASVLAGAAAILFDLDGVLTPTVEVHMRAWERLFAPFLAEHGSAPYTTADYHDFIDGKPRYDGVRSLLADRGIALPDGSPDDPPGESTVCALGNRKNDAFTAELAEHGIRPYPGSLRFLDALARTGIRIGVVTSSKNGPAVLDAAGIADRVEVLVDGNVAAAEHLPGKPAPDTYLRGAELLGLGAPDCVVVEDALSGVASGRAGRFGLVIGVDRGAGADALLASGADLVVGDLDDLIPALPASSAPSSSAPSASQSPASEEPA